MSRCVEMPLMGSMLHAELTTGYSVRGGLGSSNNVATCRSRQSVLYCCNLPAMQAVGGSAW